MKWPRKKPPKPEPIVYLKRLRPGPVSAHDDVYDDVLQDRTPEQNERLMAWWDETRARLGSALEVRTMRHHEDDFAGRLADPPGSPAPTTIVDALDELIDKLKRERTP